MHSFHNDTQLTPLLKGQDMTIGEAPPAFSMETAFSSHAGSDDPHNSASINSQLICRRCHHLGVDVKMLDCGCCLHAVSFCESGIRHVPS